MIIAIIPARGGSKRIYQKNIRFFAGKPIIAYSIQAAKESKLFDRVIVSTDSDEIAEVARAWGAEVPFRRPDALANDYATISDVMVHAVEWVSANGGCDFFCCIYPTAPFLRPEYLRQGLEQMRHGAAKAAVGVARFSHSVERALKLNGGGCLELYEPRYSGSGSQQSSEAYHDASQFFWAEARNFLRDKSILLNKPLGVVLPRKLVHSFASSEDWELAELAYLAINRPDWTAPRLCRDLPSDASRIVLGTAQLGFTYGIANRAGRPTAQEANSMLCASWAGGVRLYDTAQAYGDAEYVLGDFFAGSYGFSDARFISKLHPDLDVQDEGAIRCHVAESLRRLKTNRVWALLLHRERHFDQWDGPLGKTLCDLRDQGVLANLGVSVYHPEYARRALMAPEFGVVEIPAGCFNRTMARAQIAELAARSNKLLLVRSIFLQGLTFLEPSEIPVSIPYGREAVSVLRNFCREHGLDPREFAFDYVRSIYPAALIVLGADTAAQVALNCRLAERSGASRELVEAWDRAWPEDHPGLYDPSTWSGVLDTGLASANARPSSY